MIFTVIAAPRADEFLNSGADPCFGKHFAKSALQCIECRAPVVFDGQVRLMREVCAVKTRGADTAFDLHRLTSTDVLQRLERGDPLHVIFKEILGEVPPVVGAAAARQLLVDRLLYLQSVGIEKRVVPRAKVMLETLKSEETVK